MAEPLDDLRLPVAPVAPSPAFAERLRARLEGAILRPMGANMTTEQRPDPDTGAATEDEVWRPTLQPYLGVTDARSALEWYVRVFDAERRGEPYVMPDGSIGHAELGIGNSVLALADYGPPPPEPGTTGTGPVVTVQVTVPDVDETVRRAVEGGAELEREPTDEPYGRVGVIRDPFGHRWMVMGRPPWATPNRPGTSPP